MNDHKNLVKEVFDRAAPGYGESGCSFFDYFGKNLVRKLEIGPNQSILDVATGKGALLFPAAQAVGPLGKVIGIDISQEMLNETKKLATLKNFDWVDLQQMDAEVLNFPDNFFDFVFCGFGLFFIPSVPKALSEFKRVLKPGGKLGVSTWGKDSELDRWINQETKKLGIKNSLSISPLWSEEDLKSALRDAFFTNVQIFEESKVFFHRTPEDWWKSLWTLGTRAKLEQLSLDQLNTLHTSAIKKAKELDSELGVSEELQVFYGIAQKN